MLQALSMLCVALRAVDRPEIREKLFAFPIACAV